MYHFLRYYYYNVKEQCYEVWGGENVDIFPIPSLMLLKKANKGSPNKFKRNYGNHLMPRVIQKGSLHVTVMRVGAMTVMDGGCLLPTLSPLVANTAQTQYVVSGPHILFNLLLFVHVGPSYHYLIIIITIVNCSLNRSS